MLRLSAHLIKEEKFLPRKNSSSFSSEDAEIVFQGYTIAPGKPVLTTVSAIIDNRTDIEPVSVIDEVYPKEEIARFNEAIKLSLDSLQLLSLKLRSDRERVASDIVVTQIALIQDPFFQSFITEGILSRGQRVEQAVNHAMFHLRHAFSAIDSGKISEKYEDIEDILYRILHALKKEKKEKASISIQKSLVESKKGDIGAVLAYSIPPSIASELSPYGIQALVTSEGGTMSHTAVIMKSLGIPYISGISHQMLTIAQPNDSILIDPKEGTITLRPTLERMNRTLHTKKSDKGEASSSICCSKQRLRKNTVSSALALDLQATVHTADEVQEAIKSQAGSIGLFRSEYIAFRKGYVPSFEEQVEEYRSILLKSQGKCVTFRTFDFSSDKESFLVTEQDLHNKNSLHGILLRKPIHESLLQEQIFAIVTAAEKQPIRLLFPMISSKEEMDVCVGIFNKAWSCYRSTVSQDIARPKIGIMVELPLTGVTFSSFYKKIDFISLGTNDLLQYALAVDRSSRLAHPEDARLISSHMGYLHILYHIIQKAAQQGIPLSVCGEMAGDPLFLPLLLGFGARSISVSPKVLTTIRSLLKTYEIHRVEALANDVLAATSSQQIANILHAWSS